MKRIIPLLFTLLCISLGACATELPDDRQSASSEDPATDDLLVPELELQGDPSTQAVCHNTACTTTAQCRTWCNDSTAYCARILEGSPLKMCFITF